MRTGLQALNLKVGVSKLIFYKEAGTTGQIQLNDCNWSNPLTDADLTDWNGDKTQVETVFTQKTETSFSFPSDTAPRILFFNRIGSLSRYVESASSATCLRAR